MVRDIVCGMIIDEANAAASVVYLGKVFYFCSNVCKERFELTPRIFLPQEIV